MTPERYRQISKLLEAALRLEPEQRSAFLEGACAGDHELRRDVESLIGSDAQAGSFLAGGALEIAAGLMDPAGMEAGRKIGHYEILALLGAGGMGKVYLARDARLGRKVALKLLPSEFTQDADRLQRFKQEASAASALNHPNILTIYEIGESDGMQFIATEFIEGETLREQIAETPMSTYQVLHFAEQIASALSAAHEAAIIHRDLKPENIMVRRDSIIKVVDFGLAKLTRQPFTNQESATLIMVRTESGAVMGTLPYMSPEQALGRELDPRSDIFSLGVLFYEMATSQSPFASANASQTLDRILHLQPEPIGRLNPDMPGEMERIVSKCLEKDPGRRYGSARQLMVDLKNLKRDLELGAHSPVAGRQESSRRLNWSRHRLAVAAMVLLFVAALTYLLLSRVRTKAVSPETKPLTAASSQIKSVAVLPLQNLSGDPTQEYFADGMTEALINNLARIQALQVISRTSIMRYKESDKLLPEIARELNVEGVIDGSVQQSGGRVRVTIQLIHAATDTHLWAGEYERDLTDVLKLESEVARAVADEIRIQVTAEERARLTSARRVDPRAYDAYQLGRHHYNKGNDAGWKQAIQYFESATQISPDYAAAYAGLSDAWLQRGVFEAKFFKEAEAPARAAALKAIEIDEQLAEAHISLANIKQLYDWNWTDSELEINRALELDPGSLQAHINHGTFLMTLGRHEDAIREGKIAVQMDPLSSATQTSLGRFLYRAKKYAEAVPHLKRAVELEPRSVGANFRLGDVYAQLGDYQEAIAAFEKGGEMSPENGLFTAGIARVFALMGRRAEARKMLKGLRANAVVIAGVYAALGDNNEAFRILEKAIEERSSFLVVIKEDPPLEKLRTDPRWNALLRRLNFTVE